MNEWMNERTNERTDERTNERTIAGCWDGHATATAADTSLD